MTDYVFDYEGEEINIAITPVGCTIADKHGWRGHQIITLSSTKDAEMLISYLEHMIMVQCQNDMMKNIESEDELDNFPPSDMDQYGSVQN